jgi:hypothetical protein
MSDPLVPNYKPGVGRLVTDRFDFQNHIDGYGFRHLAQQIDLFPTVVIGVETKSNVQDAIATLAAFTVPPVVPDATPGSKGIVQLTGDISGFANNVVVTRLQGKPVSTLTPNDGDVLTWDGGALVWSPSPATNAFTATGDLAGTNIVQQVVGLTGAGGNITASCNAITWISGATAFFTQASTALTHGNNFTITAQSATGNTRNGGDVVLQGGGPGAGGLRGGVQLRMHNGAVVMAQFTEVAANRRVMSLLHGGPLTTIDMPANTGDMVMYIRNAVTPPTSGNPINGSILYSSGGQLWVKQQDGNNFSVGSAPNPVIWGSSGQQVYEQRAYITSTIGAPALALTFTLVDNTATMVEVTFVGKGAGIADSAQFNLAMGYVRNGGGAPVAVGAVTSTNPRTTAAAAAWILPTIGVIGNVLQINTGYSNTGSVSWLVNMKLTISQG